MCQTISKLLFASGLAHFINEKIRRLEVYYNNYYSVKSRFYAIKYIF